MKRLIQSAGLCLGLMTTMASITATSASEWADVNTGDWYGPYVNYVVEQGIMTGEEGVFSPFQASNRGTVAESFAQIGGDFQGLTIPNGYTDVLDTPYVLGVAWCVEKGVMTGYSEDFFGSYEGLTREAFATSLFRLGQHFQVDQSFPLSTLSGFSDVSAVSYWAEEAMSWAVGMGLMNGYQGKLNPQGPVTRCDLAVMLTAFNHMRQGTAFDIERYAVVEKEESQEEFHEEFHGEGTLLYSKADENAEVIGATEETLTVVATGENGWALVEYQGGFAYASGMASSEELPSLYDMVGFVDDRAVIYAEPSGESVVVGEISKACLVDLLARKDGWFLLSTGGYINWADVERELSEYRMKEAQAAVVFPTELATGAELGQQIAEYALHFLDYPYLDGLQSLNGFNCAGFANYIYGCFGLDIGVTPYEMYGHGIEIDKSEIQPGDLLIFGSISHVSIYIGDNKIVHAATPPDRVIISDLSESYYSRYYHSARRFYEVIPQES